MSENRDHIVRRDYFAANCPDSWFEKAMPRTTGEMRDAMIKRGIIPRDRAHGDVLRSYDDNDRLKLMASLRWEYADLMIEIGEA